MALKFEHLTRPAIRKLQAGERITEHGITAERQKNGGLRYSINIMVDGQRIHRVIGRDSDGVTREQAERAIENFRTKAREGRLDLPTGRKRHRTFKESGEEYLARIKGNPKHGKNFVRKQKHIRDRLIPHFKTARLDKITDEYVSSYIEARLADGVSEATVNRELSTLSHFLNRAAYWWKIRSKPNIEKFEEKRKQIEILTQTERHDLLQAAIADQDPLTWLFVAIAIGTGMRHSELLRIKWERIEFDLRRIHIPEAKAGMREQPIPKALADRLRKHWRQIGEPSGWVFPTARNDAKTPHRTSMAKQFARTVERAGMSKKRVTPHVLRHTAITDLVTAGIPLPTIQKISGHKTLAMVLRYTQLADDHVSESVDTLGASFSDAITPRLHIGGKVADIASASKIGKR
ncbi:tyrosine-type recombinase/integrase [Qipengyuania aquimaris]|uniref:Site-specific integrase n=1 Tax=Qipengyuania aquimaris TaxID=255984 RepID=A0A9Q3XDG4_9SPHN|nr:site-specific integrase [Qipengyuania aquimaris]MBY6219022.1 site-specific integrase [Qipengyuania aquimaris]